jgi:hypothetical protein
MSYKYVAAIFLRGMLLYNNNVVKSGDTVAGTAQNAFRICWPPFPPDTPRSLYFAVMWNNDTNTLYWFKRLRLRAGGKPERADTCVPYTRAPAGAYTFAILIPNPHQKKPNMYMLKKRSPWNAQLFSQQFPTGLDTAYSVHFNISD